MYILCKILDTPFVIYHISLLLKIQRGDKLRTSVVLTSYYQSDFII